MTDVSSLLYRAINLGGIGGMIDPDRHLYQCCGISHRYRIFFKLFLLDEKI